MIGSPLQCRKKPICAGLCLTVPATGILLMLGLMRLSAFRGSGDFSIFAPAIVTCIIALPLGLIGVALAIAAFIRKEKWTPVTVAGIILNVVILSMFAIFVLDL